MDAKERFFREHRDSTKAEIEGIVNESFELPTAFIHELDKRTESFLILPTFLYSNKELEAFRENESNLNENGAKLKSLSKSELLTEKESLKDELQLLHESAIPIFRAVANVLKNSIKEDFEYLQSKEHPFEREGNELSNLLDKARDLVAFFGVRYSEGRANSGGLLFGTDVDSCLASISHIGDVSVVLEQSDIPQDNHFSTNQTDVSLQKLEALQKLALPKAKRFISIQLVLNGSLEKTGAGVVIDEQVKKLSRLYKRDGRVKYSEDEVSLLMALRKKHPSKPRLGLSKLIYTDTTLPASIKDHKFDKSAKHVRRQDKVFSYFDKNT
jgi:hypothetical protein